MFDIQLLLNGDTGDGIWTLVNERLKGKEMLPQAILKRIRARVICTTDDPSDDLRYHEMAKK